MSYYKIKGTLQVSVQAESAIFTIFTDSTYLIPDKKSATAYSMDGSGVCLLKLNNNKITFNKVSKIPAKLEDYLLQLALQNKYIGLHVNAEGDEIIGFTYLAS